MPLARRVPEAFWKAGAGSLHQIQRAWEFQHRILTAESVTRHTPKLTIPAPAMLHMRPGRAGISREAYPDLAEFWQDVAAAYREEIAALGAAGCTYLQLDDTSFAYLCDEKFRASMRERGDDPDALLAIYAEAINQAIAGRPAGMHVTMHTCRGNFKSTWVASGGYDPAADIVFNRIHVDGCFLEFDSDRAGTFEPLRFVPKGKKVVLGLVTTKAGQLEDKDISSAASMPQRATLRSKTYA